MLDYKNVIDIQILEMQKIQQKLVDRAVKEDSDIAYLSNASVKVAETICLLVNLVNNKL